MNYRFILFFITLFTILTTTYSLQFSLRQGEETCISKEVLENDVVNGQYSLLPENEQVTASVRDPLGDLVYMKPGVSEGSFAFTAPKAGSYKVCFQNNLTQGLKTMRLRFLSKEESSSKATARKVALKPIEAQIGQLSNLIESIKKEDKWISNKQIEMKEQNESLGTYVMMFQLILLIVVTAGYFIQMWYLKQYFVSKRIMY